MTRLTALIVISNYPENILIESGLGENKKFAGLLYLLREGKIHNMLISTKAIFESDEDAKQSLHNYVKELQDMFENNKSDGGAVSE